MANIIKIKRGLKANLPTLEIGEQAYCTDTNELFIGTSSGNVLVNEGTEINELNDIGDVVIASPSANEALVFDGTNWVNDDLDLDGKVNKSGDTMTGNLTLGNNQLIFGSPNVNIAKGTVNGDLTIKAVELMLFQLGSTDVLTLDRIVETEETSISVNSHKIENVGTPTQANDAATKNYVDNELSNALDDIDVDVPASISDANDTNVVTTSHTRQVNAAINSRASSDRSQVNASIGSLASNLNSQVNASRDCVASGTQSQVNASGDSNATVLRTQVNASRNSNAGGQYSQVNASQDGVTGGTRSQVNASINVDNLGDNSVISASSFSEIGNNALYGFIASSTNAAVAGEASSVIASVNSSTGGGSQSAVLASRFSLASGNLNSLVAAGNGSLASGNRSAVFTSLDSQAISTSSTVMTSTNSTATNVRALTLSSVRTRNNTIDSIAGGTGTTGGASTANRKWHIFSSSGNIQIAGTLSSNVNFSDFAELFPNATGKEQGYGLLQTLDGYGVKPAQENDKVIGVVSATAGVLLNDTSFHWQGRYLVDEWGKPVMEEIKDPNYELQEDETEADIPLIKVQKENPNWKPGLKQVSRKDRPDEWTVVGLTGQVYVRLNENVKVGDNVKAWKNGIGQTSELDTNITVMKITQPYDSKKGYAIGFCLIK